MKSKEGSRVVDLSSYELVAILLHRFKVDNGIEFLTAKQMKSVVKQLNTELKRRK